MEHTVSLAQKSRKQATGKTKRQATVTAKGVTRGPHGQKPEEHKTEIVELFNIADNSNKATTAVELDQPLFEPSPRVVEFLGYEPFRTTRAVLKLRNSDQVMGAHHTHSRHLLIAPFCPGPSSSQSSPS